MQRARGTPLSIEELLDAAERIDEELADEPLLQADLWDDLSETRASSGDYDAASKLIDKALAAKRAHLPPNDLSLVESLTNRARSGTPGQRLDARRRPQRGASGRFPAAGGRGADGACPHGARRGARDPRGTRRGRIEDGGERLGEPRPRLPRPGPRRRGGGRVPRARPRSSSVVPGLRRRGDAVPQQRPHRAPARPERGVEAPLPHRDREARSGGRARARARRLSGSSALRICSRTGWTTSQARSPTTSARWRSSRTTTRRATPSASRRRRIWPKRGRSSRGAGAEPSAGRVNPLFRAPFLGQ